jgi:tetratricopeptide (TPR) repeat protein
MRFHVCLVLLLVALLSCRAADEALDAANRAYTYGSYDEAAQQFARIIQQRGYSAALCFDLGNAEARAGHPGAALLNLERARYLAPGDADIDHNLQLVRKQAGLDPNSYRWWQTMLRSINWTVWMALIVACLVLIALAIVGLPHVSRIATSLRLAPATLRTVFRLFLFVGIPVALLMGYVELATIGFSHRIEGVVVAAKSATLRLSPFDSAESVGQIPEGELVTVEDRHKDYLRIEARDHHFGWIKRSDLEPVIPGSFEDAESR